MKFNIKSILWVSLFLLLIFKADVLAQTYGNCDTGARSCVPCRSQSIQSGGIHKDTVKIMTGCRVEVSYTKKLCLSDSVWDITFTTFKMIDANCLINVSTTVYRAIEEFILTNRANLPVITCVDSVLKKIIYCKQRYTKYKCWKRNLNCRDNDPANPDDTMRVIPCDTIHCCVVRLEVVTDKCNVILGKKIIYDKTCPQFAYDKTYICPACNYENEKENVRKAIRNRIRFEGNNYQGPTLQQLLDSLAKMSRDFCFELPCALDDKTGGGGNPPCPPNCPDTPDTNSLPPWRDTCYITSKMAFGDQDLFRGQCPDGSVLRWTPKYTPDCCNSFDCNGLKAIAKAKGIMEVYKYRVICCDLKIIYDPKSCEPCNEGIKKWTYKNWRNKEEACEMGVPAEVDGVIVTPPDNRFGENNWDLICCKECKEGRQIWIALPPNYPIGSPTVGACNDTTLKHIPRSYMNNGVYKVRPKPDNFVKNGITYQYHLFCCKDPECEGEGETKVWYKPPAKPCDITLVGVNGSLPYNDFELVGNYPPDSDPNWQVGCCDLDCGSNEKVWKKYIKTENPKGSGRYTFTPVLPVCDIKNKKYYKDNMGNVVKWSKNKSARPDNEIVGDTTFVWKLGCCSTQEALPIAPPQELVWRKVTTTTTVDSVGIKTYTDFVHGCDDGTIPTFSNNQWVQQPKAYLLTANQWVWYKLDSCGICKPNEYNFAYWQPANIDIDFASRANLVFPYMVDSIATSDPSNPSNTYKLVCNPNEGKYNLSENINPFNNPALILKNKWVPTLKVANKDEQLFVPISQLTNFYNTVTSGVVTGGVNNFINPAPEVFMLNNSPVRWKKGEAIDFNLLTLPECDSSGVLRWVIDGADKYNYYFSGLFKDYLKNDQPTYPPDTEHKWDIICCPK